MIIEVDDAGQIVLPAELVQAAPHTRLEAGREGDSVVLRPLAEKPARTDRRNVDSLPVIEGRLADPATTLYGSGGR